MTKAKKSVAGSALELILVVVAALGLALAIQAFIVKPYRIPSGSMIPTLEINQRILVNRIGNHFSSPHVGDIVVFHPPKNYAAGCADPSEGQEQSGQDTPKPCGVAQGLPSSETFVKRVVGVPGDRIQIVNGHVYRDGAPEKDAYIEPCNGLGGVQFPGRDHRSPRRLLHDGRQPRGVRRQPLLGAGPQGVDHREGVLQLLATQPDRVPLRLAQLMASSRAKTPRSTIKSVLELVATVAVAVLLALLIQAFIVKPYRIPSPSMEPTLTIGQRVLTNRLINHPSVGDIVVFHPPAGATSGNGTDLRKPESGRAGRSQCSGL